MNNIIVGKCGMHHLKISICRQKKNTNHHVRETPVLKHFLELCMWCAVFQNPPTPQIPSDNQFQIFPKQVRLKSTDFNHAQWDVK